MMSRKIYLTLLSVQEMVDSIALCANAAAHWRRNGISIACYFTLYSMILTLCTEQLSGTSWDISSAMCLLF